MSQQALSVRPIRADERARFDETLTAEHWLGGGLVGEVMRYVAEEDGEWCALLGFGSAALCVRSREELLSWSDTQRYRRLRYITNNQRFCVLDEHRGKNLASQVLSLTLFRLPADFEARWRHPVVMVETFTDPSRHLGTCYKASNFTELGTTSGYGRRAGRFVHHGGKKAYWFRLLRRDALHLLQAPFDHPLLTDRRHMQATDLNRLDLKSLLVALRDVPDPRKKRGVRHDLPQILSIATLATLRGATSLFAIGELAAELPDEALRRLDSRISPSTRKRVAPEESTIRRTLKAIDADALDEVVNAWIMSEISAERLREAEAAEIDFHAMVEEDAREQDESSKDESSKDEDTTSRFRAAVALDGKTLRGARLDNGRQVHLVSVVTHDEAATIAQANVDQKTNEITVFRPLIGSLDLADVVVTADALHTQRGHARFLTGAGAHYIFGLKENQPTLLATAQRFLTGRRVSYESDDRGHGRIEHREVLVAPITKKLARQLGFSSARQFVAVRRERCELTGDKETSETSYYVTDLTQAQASPHELATHIRRHWTIENRSHYVRDRTFDEDRSQVVSGVTS